ncbi:MAG: YebC/PmpR family DNA-binding transcriptional regulator [bacterium]
MSGHSKWHNIQGRKSKQDAKRSGSFSKHSKLVSMAAKQGGADPIMNFSLRLAIERAKADGVPKDNIERAVKSGIGDLKGSHIEEQMYECYGPAGVAILIKTVTDNKNRTVSEIKHILSKNGGSMGGSGSVLWMFEQNGVIVVDSGLFSESNIKRDDFELKAMDAGAEDICDVEDNKIAIYTKKENLQKALVKIKEMNIEVSDSSMEWIAKDKVAVDSATEEKLNRLFDELAAHDDVEDFFTNAQ